MGITSIKKNIKSSIAALIIGFLFLIGSISGIWWNEGRTIKTKRSLEFGIEHVYSSTNVNYVSPENDGKLIHVSGVVKSEETLTDSDFGIETPSLKLKRKVDIYQWKENKNEETITTDNGEETKNVTYSYEKVWKDRIINSDGFNQPEGHVNPKSSRFGEFSKAVSEAKLGAHSLNDNQLSRISSWSDFNFSEIKQMENTALISSEGRHSTIYCGVNSLENPNVGDLRITYKSIQPGDYSVIAQQAGNSFQPFRTKNGREINLITSGLKSSEDMFGQELSDNKVLKWVLRVGGFIFMFIGIRMMFSPISSLIDLIPVLGKLMSLAASLVSAILAFVISSLTAGTAWLFYRPVLGVSLLVLGIGVFLFFRNRKGGVDSVLASSPDLKATLLP